MLLPCRCIGRTTRDGEVCRLHCTPQIFRQRAAPWDFGVLVLPERSQTEHQRFLANV